MIKFFAEILFVGLILQAFGAIGIAQDDQVESVTKPESKLVYTVKPVNILSKQGTSITNPFDMRDPFKRNLPRRSRLKKNLGNQYFNGQIYTNIDTIDGVPLEQIRVVGVLLGSNRRAIVKIVSPETEARQDGEPSAKASEDTRTFVVKEGMKLGIDGAEVRAILPGGIVLVEKIRNVYDQDEYLETIIPVSE